MLVWPALGAIVIITFTTLTGSGHLHFRVGGRRRAECHYFHEGQRQVQDLRDQSFARGPSQSRRREGQGLGQVRDGERQPQQEHGDDGCRQLKRRGQHQRSRGSLDDHLDSACCSCFAGSRSHLSSKDIHNLDQVSDAIPTKILFATASSTSIATIS